jgi:hypothetical protein
VGSNIRRVYNPTTEKYICSFFEQNPHVLKFNIEIDDNMEDFCLSGFKMKL